ncbi:MULTISPECIES: DNA alkylation repair protein [Petrotoga]|uniref:DNA-7-methylguanine glycosylase n=2 Tax=Petrotoga sibirica TaxID=156202 RepID=A0A4R8F2S8_9BACT|nr:MULTISPECIES: DNA alkylation repair protein [Petrotoga]POZ88612.1 hypothetical protein AA80_04730 [Petrotoga sibirica DSM 13575]POZ90685.1 hypothetical protein AD60_05540 [Petrotoga sp. SL27]TDX17515.1 DNA-7-methylguanine glycosylase [Petrotoga sibirica]
MGFEVNDYIAKIRQAFMEKSNPENAKKQIEYMKGNFDFFGIKAQTRRKVTQEFMRKAERPDYDDIDVVIRKLWKLPEREYQYFALELLEKYKKGFEEDIISLFEYMITNKSWWDTVDFISKKLVGEFFKMFPELRDEYISKWMDSDDIWLQRTCLLFQLGYKENTDLKLLFNLIERLQGKDEFFIQKAIGWSLREYSKIEPKKIKEFIQKQDLSALSEREGLKLLKSKG